MRTGRVWATLPVIRPRSDAFSEMAMPLSAGVGFGAIAALLNAESSFSLDSIASIFWRSGYCESSANFFSLCTAGVTVSMMAWYARRPLTAFGPIAVTTGFTSCCSSLGWMPMLIAVSWAWLARTSTCSEWSSNLSATASPPGMTAMVGFSAAIVAWAMSWPAERFRPSSAVGICSGSFSMSVAPGGRPSSARTFAPWGTLSSMRVAPGGRSALTEARLPGPSRSRCFRWRAWPSGVSSRAAR